VIAYVTGLGRQDLILGYPWLQDWNPDVDWKMGSLRWRDSAGGTVKTLVEQEPKTLEYRACELEGQEVARKNSGERPKICNGLFGSRVYSQSGSGEEVVRLK
jgi:hypothetical protein